MKNVPVFRASPLSIASRALAALFGAYALASSFTAFFSLALPLHPGEAVLTASLLGFIVHVAAAIFVLGSQSAARAWAWLLGSSLLFAAGAYLLWSLR
jgi:hypothetical protein